MCEKEILCTDCAHLMPSNQCDLHKCTFWFARCIDSKCGGDAKHFKAKELVITKDITEEIKGVL